LKAMGLKHALEAGSFPGIAPSTYISEALQKTYINVDEAGTEAAAVTMMGTVTMGLGPAKPEKVFKIVLDHPFLFTLRHRNGALLFVGAIVNLPD
jgi:serine protease inhibitor